METEAALQDALRNHVEVLSIDIGPRTAFRGDSLARAARYIGDVFERSGLEVVELVYRYRGQRIANLIAAPAGVDRAAAYSRRMRRLAT